VEQGRSASGGLYREAPRVRSSRERRGSSVWGAWHASSTATAGWQPWAGRGARRSPCAHGDVTVGKKDWEKVEKVADGWGPHGSETKQEGRWEAGRRLKEEIGRGLKGDRRGRL
jgi:hypothetical protein